MDGSIYLTSRVGVGSIEIVCGERLSTRGTRVVGQGKIDIGKSNREFSGDPKINLERSLNHTAGKKLSGCDGTLRGCPWSGFRAQNP